MSLIKTLIDKVINSPMKPVYKYPLIAVLFCGFGAAAYFGVA